MRTAIPISAFAALFAFAAIGAEPKAEPPTKEQIEADLKLVAIGPKERTVEAGKQPHIGLKLVNTSKARTHLVVKPGDGSECGWRDPWIHVTADQRTVDGKWTALERLGYGRCGLFDHDWPKDVVELKPGAELVLKDWYDPGRFNFQFPGTVRIVGHYEYRAVGGKNGKARPDTERGRMAGVPLFALATEPVEFEIVRPLDVKAKVKKTLKVGVETNASDVIEITVTNNSKERRVIGNVSQNGFGVDISPLSDNATTLAFVNVPVYSNEKFIEPGETIKVFGGGTFASKADGPWKGLKPGTMRVRVSYMVPTNSSETHIIRGHDVEVRVEE